jgi:hypothetical protein
MLDWLVVLTCFNHLEKSAKVSWDDEIPSIWGNKKSLKPPISGKSVGQFQVGPNETLGLPPRNHPPRQCDSSPRLPCGGADIMGISCATYVTHIKNMSED